MLPSTPPSTDEIDTDWGDDGSSDAAPDWVADDSNEVTRVMQQPLRVQLTPPPEPEAQTSPRASVAPPDEPTPELKTTPTASPPPAEAKADPDSSVRSMRPQAPTLIGLPVPNPPNEDPHDSELSEPSAADTRDSAPPPMPSAAYSEPVRPPSEPPAPLAAPSAPPPASSPRLRSTPPPPISAPSSSPPARSAPFAPPPSTPPPASAASSPPPAVPAPSSAPAARPSAPAPASSVPGPRVLSATPSALAGSDPGRHPSGFGRWLLVLAAGLVVVCALGYRVLTRYRAALAESAATHPPPEPPVAALPAATGEPSTPTSTEAASPQTSGASAEPAPAPESAAATGSAAPAASPAATTSAAGAGDLRRVTIKSKPPKVRFFHFGKQVGVTPFVLELKPGERHAYEAGLPGYNTRKVVIDGSKPEVIIGLTREKP